MPRSAAPSRSPRCAAAVASARLDVAALHMIEVPALDADQLDRRLAIGGMHGADVIKMGVARLHAIGADGFDQRRSLTLARLDDAPIRHLGYARGLSVDGPTRAVVVRAAARRPVIDMTADAKAELGILVQDLARVGAGRAFLELAGNEGLIVERPCHEFRDLRPALRASIGL